MNYEKDLKEVVQGNFTRYAGSVLADRALCDARDMLKPSARMLLYSQLNITKNTHNKPFIKSSLIVGDALGHYYNHGDQACYSTYMRLAKPFAMRVPLEECQGNSGTIIVTGDEAAMRYTELRLAPVSQYLYGGLEKGAVDEWKYNFDETEQLPCVMPSIGFYNLVNGTIGLGIAISSSIPSFNLKEMNEKIIDLIKNPNLTAEECVIMPDFATGGTLMNEEEVKQSLIDGKGKSCRIRAKMSYSPDINAIVVSEIPYNVYTSTITKEIKGLLEENENYGVKEINDGSGVSPDYTIYLEKGVNPEKMIKKLYKDTSLESHFTINMWALDKGRFPKIFSLKDFFSSYITHIRSCKTREVQFDLNKALSRKNIVDGLILAAASIDEIVSLIRGSTNPAEASSKLAERFNFNEEQIKAILAMKLSSLTKIDAIKLEDEKKDLLQKIDWLQHLLNDAAALDEELIKVLREVAEKFGDARRTKILNVMEEDEEETESVQEDELEVAIYDNNTIYATKIGDKKKQKVKKNVKQIGTLYSTSFGRLAIFTKDGKMYSQPLSEVEYGVEFVLPYNNIVNVIDAQSLFSYKHILFITKQGMLKKSDTKDYSTQSRKGVQAIKMRENDSVVNVFFSSNENDRILIAANTGYSVFFNHSEIASIGRASMGVKAIKLKDDEYVADATIVKETAEYKGILTVSSSRKGKITPIMDFPETSRAVKGNLAHRLDKEEELYMCQAIETSNKQFADLVPQGRITEGKKLKI